MKPYLQLVRAPAVFTALSNILAAHLIVTAGAIQWPPLTILMGASACLYMAGMVLNDCFDYREDCRERPHRPLPAGQVALPVAWMLGWSLLAAGVLLAAAVGWLQLALAAILAVAIVIYDGVAKGGLAGGLIMGGCRYLNWLLGLSLLGVGAGTLLLAAPIFIYVTALTLLSAVETNARHRAPLVFCITGVAATALLIVAMVHQGVLANAWALLPLLAAAALALQRLLAAYREFTPAAVQRSMTLLITGIIPLDAILVFADGPWWGGIVVLGLILPAKLLGRFLYVT